MGWKKWKCAWSHNWSKILHRGGEGAIKQFHNHYFIVKGINTVQIDVLGEWNRLGSVLYVKKKKSSWQPIATVTFRLIFLFLFLCLSLCLLFILSICVSLLLYLCLGCSASLTRLARPASSPAPDQNPDSQFDPIPVLVSKAPSQGKEQEQDSWSHASSPCSNSHPKRQRATHYLCMN